MADLRDAISREIDEELRREQLLKLWDKYGVYVLGAALAAILAVAGWKGYEYRRAQANETASNQYFLALGELAAKRTDEAQKALEGLAAAPSGYAALARLRLAAQDAADGNTLDAVSAYDQIAKDKAVDPILQDYARLQVAMLKFDTLPFPELRTQLSPLANDRSPWRYTARELLGVGAARAGFGPEARSHFQRLLADRTTPPGISERARIMVALLDDQDRAKEAPAADDKSAVPPKGDAAEDKAKPAPDNSK
ncbi:MAG: tetratricopeptide repeat protein [Hyphomicrobiaceae bacterium]|nr:tetratricopeptide repeat protein [Hyphomicrobiaceae bacterium]